MSKFWKLGMQSRKPINPGEDIHQVSEVLWLETPTENIWLTVELKVKIRDIMNQYFRPKEGKYYTLKQIDKLMFIQMQDGTVTGKEFLETTTKTKVIIPKGLL